jgi:4-aminobutyrate aminotransferase / (S)-3-amino-2-methylpropionate transaminase / 5-aminovalerate transaminase
MTAIQLKTSVPGPRSQELMRRREAAVPRGVFHSTSVFAARAEGVILEDVDGNRFIDFAGGIGCVNVGHRAAPVLAAVRAQLDRFLHTCFSVAPYESYIRVAEKLNQITPGKFPKKTFLANSGAEAVENAVKIARAYTKRPAIICFEDAFHGRTLLALTLTSKTHPYKANFDPFASDVYRIPYGYCSRCAAGETHADCPASPAALEKVFKRVVAAESVAAVIAEPILGEGGFMAPPTNYYKDLIEILRRHGILFIADEVQTGIARTGKMFSCEHYGIEPDLLITAKSLGGGFPLSAVTGRAEIMDAPEVGGLGGTFCGNAVSCEAALAVLEMVEKENLCSRATSLGERFVARAQSWQQRWPSIAAIHGLGAMRSLELVRPEKTRKPADDETKQIVKYCYEHGLITISAGTFGNVIRLLMPLVITDAQFDEGLTVLESALQQVFGAAAAAAGDMRPAAPELRRVM